MKTILSNYKTHILLLCITWAFIVFFVIWNDTRKEKRIIPQKPFIVIGYRPIDLNVLDKGVQYDVIDKNGYVFHFSEYVSILDKPRYSLGDTLK